jgi:DNA-binding phage protein
MREALPRVAAEQQEQIITLDEHERRYIARVLVLLQDNRSRTAEALGIDRRTLYRKLESWGLPTWRTPPAARRALEALTPAIAVSPLAQRDGVAAAS